MTQSSAPNDAVVDAAVSLWQATNRHHWLAASGTSMEPLIHHSDRLLIDYAPLTPRPGDIVLCREQTGLVAHRIIYIERRYSAHMVLSKGDNVTWFDRPHPAADLIGRVVAVARAGRILRLDTPWWRAAGWSLAHYTNIAAVLYRAYLFVSFRAFSIFRLPRATIAPAHTLLRLFLRLAGEPPR